ncbi:MAG TPA: hypothetical protein VHB79_04145 [Polyangiaceae bacterium]|nr:hypothetical protein [Polyangiaceae bacterium]
MAEMSDAHCFRGARTLPVSLGLALLGFVLLAVGWSTARSETLFAYLVAFAFLVALALGALIFLMIAYVVRARWSVVLRRLNEAIVSVFPLLALLFVPIACGLSEIYSWVEPATAFSGRELALLRHKAPYLNGSAFLARSALYWVVWTIASWLIGGSRTRAAHRAERRSDDDDALNARERRLSGAFLPLVSLTLTFASFDWLMSLQPLWSSSLFGVYFFAGGFVSSFGLLAFLAFLAHRSPGGDALIRPAHFHALGRLMLGFTIFWAYCAFFQALLIQIADKPAEVSFYTTRLRSGWRALTWSLAALRFVVPFVLLLPRELKFRPGAMALLGLLLVCGEYLDVLWLVSPAQNGTAGPTSLWNFAALLAVGGSAVAFASWRLRGHSWVPLEDPQLATSVAYRSPL